EDQVSRLMIGPEDRPLLHRAIYDIKNRPITFQINFNDWKVNSELGDNFFTFTPPPKSEKVKSLNRLIGGIHPLEGKEAPDFELKTLEGETVTLSQHEGKDIVILDFWATWCGPCRQAMPIIENVSEEF